MAKSRTGNKKSRAARFPPPAANLGLTSSFQLLRLWESHIAPWPQGIPCPGLSLPPPHSPQDNVGQPGPIHAPLPGAPPAPEAVAFFSPRINFHIRCPARGKDGHSHLIHRAREPGDGCWLQVWHWGQEAMVAAGCQDAKCPAATLHSEHKVPDFLTRRGQWDAHHAPWQPGHGGAAPPGRDRAFIPLPMSSAHALISSCSQGTCQR